jgi:CheY-like chemotaxis protein
MGKKILIVDDEPDIVIFLTTLFEKNGYETVSASDGEKGLEIAGREKPDLVTLDLQMPKETGTGFYKKFARDKTLKEIPIIVISGLAGKHLAVKQPIAIFDKPIDADKLMEVVRSAIG